MLLTPTMIGALLAGIALWALFWSFVSKIDCVPYVRDVVTTRGCFDWIEERPGLVLLLTETVNYLFHGVSSPLAVGFCMGGTILNMLFVYGYIPSRRLLLLFSAAVRAYF